MSLTAKHKFIENYKQYINRKSEDFYKRLVDELPDVGVEFEVKEQADKIFKETFDLDGT